MPKESGIVALLLEDCESTNDLARKHGEGGAASGSWVSARLQTRGRGRAGNTWISQPGNLFLSVVLRPDPALLAGRSAELTWVPLLAACVCRSAVLALRPELEDSLRIKWPNDLWLGASKAGGILCEGVGGASGQFLIVGMGLNTSLSPELSERSTASLGVSADQLRETIPQLLVEGWERLQREGSAAIRTAYVGAAYFRIGDEVSWLERGTGVRGAVLGLGPYGDLRVRVTEGQSAGERSIFADEVSKVTR